MILEGFTITVTVQAPRDALNVKHLGDGISPRSQDFLALIFFPRGSALGVSRHQPRRAIRLRGTVDR